VAAALTPGHAPGRLGPGRRRSANCPEIIAVQYKASRLLRYLSPEQLILAQVIAATEEPVEGFLPAVR